VHQPRGASPAKTSMPCTGAACVMIVQMNDKSIANAAGPAACLARVLPSVGVVDPGQRRCPALSDLDRSLQMTGNASASQAYGTAWAKAFAMGHHTQGRDALFERVHSSC
jgi:hypothetical protein